ncbi:MAG: transporter substrate-binding domain-containing protein [Geminicoccaceae bacterium]
MTITRRFFQFGAACLVAGGLTSHALAQNAGQEVAAASVIEEIKQRGTLNVGLSTFVPWSMFNKDSELIGFEIDVAKRLAEDMGVEIEFVPTAWDGIIPALIAGKFDLVISGMTITTERNLTVNFTDAYAHSGMRLVATKKFEGEKSTLADFNSSDVTFSLRRGSTPTAYAKEVFPKANLLLFDDDGASIQEVLNGNSDATLGYEPNPSDWVRDYPDSVFIPFDDLLNPGSEGMALRKGDPDALNFLNNWIEARWRDGFLKERNDYWFRGNDWADQMPE